MSRLPHDSQLISNFCNLINPFKQAKFRTASPLGPIFGAWGCTEASWRENVLGFNVEPRLCRWSPVKRCDFFNGDSIIIRHLIWLNCYFLDKEHQMTFDFWQKCKFCLFVVDQTTPLNQKSNLKPYSLSFLASQCCLLVTHPIESCHFYTNQAKY